MNISRGGATSCSRKQKDLSRLPDGPSAVAYLKTCDLK